MTNQNIMFLSGHGQQKKTFLWREQNRFYSSLQCRNEHFSSSKNLIGSLEMSRIEFEICDQSEIGSFEVNESTNPICISDNM